VRTTSDVNFLLILKKFERETVDVLREPLRSAHAAIRLEVMFLLESEIEKAMDSFAVKFSDILTRRKILYGPDLFSNLAVSRKAILNRTQQVLLNLILRQDAQKKLCPHPAGRHDERCCFSCRGIQRVSSFR
jgi:hypothetical protein